MRGRRPYERWKRQLRCLPFLPMELAIKPDRLIPEGSRIFPVPATGHKEREMLDLFGIRPTALNCLKQNLFVCFCANRDRTLR